MELSDELSFHKLLTYILMLYVDTLQFPALHDLIHSRESSENVFVCIIYHSSDRLHLLSLEPKAVDKNANSDTHTSTTIYTSAVGECEQKSAHYMYILDSLLH